MIIRAVNVTRVKTAAITEAILSGSPWSDGVVKSGGSEGVTCMWEDDADIEGDGVLLSKSACDPATDEYDGNTDS